MSQGQERRRDRVLGIKIPKSSRARGCLGFVVAIVLVLSSMFVVFPIIARLVGDVAVGIEPGSAKMGAFFWLIAALAAMPAIGFTVVSAGLRGRSTGSAREVWAGVSLIYLSFGWPMFMMGTQYKSVSTVRFSERHGVSLRVTEFLQDTALVAFSVSFTSFFSMYVFMFAFRKLGRRVAWLVVGVYLVFQAMVFVLVGRNIGAGRWW